MEAGQHEFVRMPKQVILILYIDTVSEKGYIMCDDTVSE